MGVFIVCLGIPSYLLWHTRPVEEAEFKLKGVDRKIQLPA